MLLRKWHIDANENNGKASRLVTKPQELMVPNRRKSPPNSGLPLFDMEMHYLSEISPHDSDRHFLGVFNM